jgi:hypothetical protein
MGVKSAPAAISVRSAPDLRLRESGINITFAAIILLHLLEALPNHRDRRLELTSDDDDCGAILPPAGHRSMRFGVTFGPPSHTFSQAYGEARSRRLAINQFLDLGYDPDGRGGHGGHLPSDSSSRRGIGIAAAEHLSYRQGEVDDRID